MEYMNYRKSDEQIAKEVEFKMHFKLAKAISENDASEIVDLVKWHGATAIQIEDAGTIADIAREYYSNEVHDDLVWGYIYPNEATEDVLHAISMWEEQ